MTTDKINRQIHGGEEIHASGVLGFVGGQGKILAAGLLPDQHDHRVHSAIRSGMVSLFGPSTSSAH